MFRDKLFCSILLVHDEPLVLRQLSSVLTSRGYFRVKQAGDFHRAQQILSEAPVDILIANLVLPDGDGRRLALEALRHREDTLVVLISPFSGENLMLTPELRDRVVVLEEPFVPEEIDPILHKLAINAGAGTIAQQISTWAMRNLRINGARPRCGI